MNNNLFMTMDEYKLRLKVLEELGFKYCIWVDEGTGEHHTVLSIGCPDQGYKPSEIADMSEKDFDELCSLYVN